MNRIILFLFLIAIGSCKNPTEVKSVAAAVTDTTAVQDFREFKVLDSKYISKTDLWNPFEKNLGEFTETIYNKLKPLIFKYP